MVKLAIDLGTSMTKIYMTGSGIVLAEPTCIAVSADGKGIKAIGAEAKKLVGKTAEYTSIIFPVFEGDIVNVELCVEMLKYFLKKINGRGSLRGAETLFCVPCGASVELREKYLALADGCRLGRVNFVEVPFLASLGQDVPLSEANPNFAIDIGAGVTNLAAFSLDGIIVGLSINIGGANIDSHIIDHIAQEHSLKIGLLTAENLKIKVGSLYANDNMSAIINGRDVETGRPRSVSVSSSDVLEPVSIYVDKIIEYAEMLLAKLPAEVSAVIWHKGIYVSGGTANLAGIKEYFAKKMQIDVHLAEEPQAAVVLGGGRTVGNAPIMKMIGLKA